MSVAILPALFPPTPRALRAGHGRSASWATAGGLLDGVRTSLRRIVALLLAVAFAISCAETLIADVHDGDAEAEASIRRVATAPADAPLAPAAPSDDTDGPGHAHVCHCTHAHGGMLSCGDSVVAAVVFVDEAHGARSDRIPPSPAPERRLRPPALPIAA